MRIQYLNEWVDTEEVDDNVGNEDDETLANEVGVNARKIMWDKYHNSIIKGVIISLIFRDQPDIIKSVYEDEKRIEAIDNAVGNDLYNIEYDYYNNKILINLKDLKALKALNNRIVLTPGNIELEKLYNVFSEYFSVKDDIIKNILKYSLIKFKKEDIIIKLDNSNDNIFKLPKWEYCALNAKITTDNTTDKTQNNFYVAQGKILKNQIYDFINILSRDDASDIINLINLQEIIDTANLVVYTDAHNEDNSTEEALVKLITKLIPNHKYISYHLYIHETNRYSESEGPMIAENIDEDKIKKEILHKDFIVNTLLKTHNDDTKWYWKTYIGIIEDCRRALIDTINVSLDITEK